MLENIFFEHIRAFLDKKFACMPKMPYLCSVFFMVLDFKVNAKGSS